jgi:hypothetical protein
MAQTHLIAPITFDDFLSGFSRSPKHSSPRADGLPYEVLGLLVTRPACREIVLAVFNNALALIEFPKFWQETSVSLLLKKGDLSDLKN